MEHALPIILGIIVPLISLAVIYFIFMHLKYVPLYRKAYPVESQELSERVRNEDTVEQQPFLRIESVDTSESPPTIRHEDENITEARIMSGNSGANDPADLMDDSDLSEHYEDAASSPTSNKQRNSEVSADEDQKGNNDELRTNELDSDTCKSAKVDISKDLKEGESTADVQRKNLKEENSVENASGVHVCLLSDKSDNEDKEESADVFEDTVDSLQRIAPPTDMQHQFSGK